MMEMPEFDRDRRLPFTTFTKFEQDPPDGPSTKLPEFYFALSKIEKTLNERLRMQHLTIDEVESLRG